MAQSPTTRPIGFSNQKMASVFDQVKIYLTSRAGLVQQQYEVHSKVRVRVRVSNDALDYSMNEYNHNARTRSPRLTAARLQLAVGRRWLGHGEQEERTRRASCVATYVSCETTHRAAALVLGSDALLKKIPREVPRHVSSRSD